MRKFIQVACGSNGFNVVVGVCDDGSVWRWAYADGWMRMPDAPQGVEPELLRKLEELAR